MQLLLECALFLLCLHKLSLPACLVLQAIRDIFDTPFQLLTTGDQRVAALINSGLVLEALQLEATSQARTFL